MLPHVYDNFVKVRAIPSISKTRHLLKDLLGSLETIFLVLDGLDECEGPHQKQMLTELSTLLLPDQQRHLSQSKLKVLICSRETKEIARKLSKAPQISLSKEQQFVSRDIATFAKNSLSELRGRFDDTIVDEI